RFHAPAQGGAPVAWLARAPLAAGTPAELAILPLPLPTDAVVPTLALNPQVGGFGAKVCAAFTGNPGAPCTTDAQCGTCPPNTGGILALCCATNNPIGLHNGPRGIAIAEDRNAVYVVNQFTTS